MTRALVASLAVALCSLVAVEARAERTRVLVLPLPVSSAVDADVARAFDARVLVALDETERIATVTPATEPECTTLACLAELGVAENAAQVLSMSILRENGALTLFATLIDARTAAAARRAELPGLSAAALARTAPAEVARQLVGTAPGAPANVAVALPASGPGRAAATAFVDRLAALRKFTVVPLDDKTDRANLTHRAEITIRDFSIVTRRHHVRRYLDGVLVGTVAITDLADGTAVFSKTIKVTVSRRFRYSSTAEVTALLVDDLVTDWMTAFRAADVATRLTGGTR
jgi:hypothetical protein